MQTGVGGGLGADWLKAHEAHFSRAKTMESAELTGIPLKSAMGPINYRPINYSGTSQTSNKCSLNQGSNSRPVESGAEAA